MQASQQRDLDAWLTQYTAAVAIAEQAAEEAIWSAYSAVDDWFDPAQTIIAATRAVAVSEAARSNHAGLMGEFIGFINQLLTGRRPLAPRQRFDYPRNADPWRVYSRPVYAAREALGDDLDQMAADLVAQARAEALLLTDVALARREAAVAAMEAAQVTHYRRVIRPELSETGTCGLCISASTRRYQTETLLPIHSRCKCTVMPIVESADADPAVLNEADLKELYSQIGETKRDALAKTRWRVEMNPELGPLLVPVGASVPRAA